MSLAVLKGDITARTAHVWDNVTVTGTLTAGTVTAPTITASGTVTAGKVKQGSGGARGTNYVFGYHSNAFTVSNATWQTMGYNTLSNSVQDDGTMWTPSTFNYISQVPGVYELSLSVSFSTSTTAGRRGARVLSQGGSVIGQTVFNGTESGIASLTLSFTMPGGGYYVNIQAWQDSGASLTALAHSSSSPQGCYFTQVA